MRDFEIGSLVRQELFSLYHDNERVFRYGVIAEKFTLPYSKENFFKVMWQPTDSYPVSRNRSYFDNVSGEKLELVNSVG